VAADPRTTPYELASAELAALDASYAPIRSFADWSAGVSVDIGVWDRYLARLEEVRASVPDELAKGALDAAIRTAAFNTGAIEGLHPPDRGLTITLATLAADWQAEVTRAQGPETLELVEAAIAGYELALDLATGNTPVSEAILRRVHEVVSGPQATYKVRTPVGDQEQPLPKGRYKEQPNHVRQRDGSLHAYAPVDRTADEMRRLVEELRADAFFDAHPVAQAAYAHHALTQIHPFADGNGRVARVLASVYLLRAASIPLVVFADRTREYYDALEAADRGNPEPLVRFVQDRAVDTLAIATELLLEAAATAEFDETRLETLAEGDAGPNATDLDAATERLVVLAGAAVTKEVEALALPGVAAAELPTSTSSWLNVARAASWQDKGLRTPGTSPVGTVREVEVAHQDRLRLGLRVMLAADDSGLTRLVLLSHVGLPSQGTWQYEIERTTFEARYDEVMPEPSVAFGIRLASFGRREARRAISGLLGQSDEDASPTDE
jgi:Fic family protein